MTEVSESSLGLNTVELGQDGEVLSSEDIAWADSCLSKDPDMLDSGWNSLKDALLETLDAQHHTPLYERDNSPEGARREIVPNRDTANIHNVEMKAVVGTAISSEGAESGPDSPRYALLETLSTQYRSSPYDTNNSPLVLQPPIEEIHSSENMDDIFDSDKTSVSIAGTSEEGEPNSDDRLNHENTDDFWSKHKMEDIFLPTYDENLRDVGASDPEMDLVFQEFQLEQSTEDIFKIWDLDVPPEENDLMKQLKKVLAQNSMEPTPPVSDDSETLKGLHDEAIDELISGIADLALSSNQTDMY